MNRGRARAALLAAMSLMCAGLLVPSATAAVGAGSPVVIQEVYGGGGNSGAAFNRDFVELRNVSDATVSLDGWAVQYASAAGSSWQVTALSGSLVPGDHLLIGMAFGNNTSLPGFDVDIEGSTPMSGTAGKVAVTSSAAALSCSIGCQDLPGVVDLVGFGAAASSFAGSGPAPGTANPTSVSRDADGTNTADNAADFTLGTPTPLGRTGGGPDDPTPEPSPDPSPEPSPSPGPEPVLTPISEIQGTGTESPLLGTVVTARGIVTAAYPTGGFQGYVIQTPGTGGPLPAEHLASEAIFVYSGATVGAVTIGDHVEVTGTAAEYQGLSQISVPAGGLTILTEPADPVTPSEVAWPATEAEREALESMLVAPQGDFTISNTYSTSQYGEVGLAFGTEPLWQPTDLARPGTPEYGAVVADNAARAVRLDDGASTNFTSSANTGLTPTYISLADPIRVGAPVTFTSAVIVDYRNALWTFNPVTQVTADDPSAYPVAFENTRTSGPDAAALGEADVTVASFNVLNYFTTLGVDDALCVPYTDRAGTGITVRDGCSQRGAWDAASFERQQSKLVAAISATDADVVGLMEIENSAALGEEPDEALASLVLALNEAAGAEVWSFVPSSPELPPIAQQDVITNAIIYQASAVLPEGEARAMGDLSGPGDPFSNAREPVAQTFAPVGGGESVTVVVNHFKSKGATGATGIEADQGDGQGAWNPSRIGQAEALSAWVGEITGPDDAVILLGDFNSYTFEDPMQVFYDAGYVNATVAFDVAATSYSFSGLSGSLDHVLLNPEAYERATGADIWEINAGEALALEYSRYNNHGTLFYDESPYRSSDHDPVIVGLTAEVAPVEVASSTSLWLSQTSASRLQFLPVLGWVEVAHEDGSRPGGRVQVKAGDRVIGTSPVVAGRAAVVFWPIQLGRGTHTLTAHYVPDTAGVAVGSSSSALTFRVR